MAFDVAISEDDRLMPLNQRLRVQVPLETKHSGFDGYMPLAKG